MKKILLTGIIALSSVISQATIHVVYVWDGYFQFTPRDITIQLGDTVQWLPLGGGAPTMVHTITSTNIPAGAVAFDQIWQAPADTFFQYIPLVVGLYDYECTPHVQAYNMAGSITVADSTVGINANVASDIKLSVYPNPTSNVLFVDGLHTNTAYSIYNLTGERVLSGNTDKVIDVSALKSGSYFIEILGDVPRAIKILKQ